MELQFKFNSRRNYSMSSEATISHLQQSLRMKISKRLIIQLSNQELILASTSESNVSLTMQFSNSSLSSLDLIPEVPSEGSISFMHQHTFKLQIEEVVDILIVDDIQFNVSVLRKLLEGLAENCTCSGPHRTYTVHSAGSAKEDLEMIKRQNDINAGYRLVIMDCLMPEMNGWEAALAIRGMYDRKEIRILSYILAYSAFDSREDILRSENAGMCGHISKPCTQRELCEAVSKWVNRSLVFT